MQIGQEINLLLLLPKLDYFLKIDSNINISSNIKKIIRERWKVANKALIFYHKVGNQVFLY